MNILAHTSKHFLNYTKHEIEKFDDLELLIEEGIDIHKVPLTPLFTALKKLDYHQLAQYLPLLSAHQRQLMVDIDVWKKSYFSPSQFRSWIKTYELVNDDTVQKQFLLSWDFLLYLRSVFRISTYDIEEGESPQHDNFFVTDDTSFLLEFDPSFDDLQTVQNLVRIMYSLFDTQVIHTLFLQLINENYTSWEFELYEQKKNRLDEIGYIDYYDALEVFSPLHSSSRIQKFISKKHGPKKQVHFSNHFDNQFLQTNVLKSLQRETPLIQDQLNLVTDSKRIQYLNFNLTRLVNASCSLNQSESSSAIQIAKIAKEIGTYTNLGCSILLESNISNVFDFFDFVDLHRIAISHIKIQQKIVSDLLKSYSLSQNFMGNFWESFIVDLFSTPPLISNTHSSISKEISTHTDLIALKNRIQLLKTLVPIIEQFHITFETLKGSGRIMDLFYCNYTLEEITFEIILISKFASFVLSDTNNEKLGLLPQEANIFFQQVTEKNSAGISMLKSSNVFNALVEKFTDNYDLSFDHFNQYFLEILAENLNGHELTESFEWKYVSGPLILNTQQPKDTPSQSSLQLS
ncbi:DUF6178 family protein [Bacteriovoracaceae bacterium]|nr:DUF6178 family protein [Bacteriovoracaceae bacterium]